MNRIGAFHTTHSLIFGKINAVKEIGKLVVFYGIGNHGQRLLKEVFRIGVLKGVLEVFFQLGNKSLL